MLDVAIPAAPQVVACTYEIGSAQDRGVGCLMLRFGWKEDEAITAAYAHAYDMRAKAGLMPTAPPADMTPKAGPAPTRPAPAAKLPDTIPHDLRRSCVRNLENAGVSRDVAKKMVGHETDAMYQRYHIVNEIDLASGAAALVRA